MANIDIEKPYFQQLASELAIPDAKQSDPYPGNVTSDDLHKLLIWVANWADLCTAPRNMEVLHPGEWGYASIDNRYGGDGMSGDYENRPYDLPIPGLTIDHFFGDALALTGQEMAELGEVYQIVVGDYVNFNRNLNNAPDDQTNVPIDQRIHQDTEPEFQRGLEVLFQTWTGPAREACQLYASHLIGYLETEKSIVGDFAQCLTAYGSIIRTARRNVVQHMQTFVNQMSAKAANDEAQTEHENQFAIAACSAVVAGLISGGFGAAGALATDASVVPGLAQAFLSTTNNIGGQVLGQAQSQQGAATATYSDIAKTYLDGVRQILNDARQAIQDLANGTQLGLVDVAQKLSGNEPIKPPLVDDHGKAEANPANPEVQSTS